MTGELVCHWVVDGAATCGEDVEQLEPLQIAALPSDVTCSTCEQALES